VAGILAGADWSWKRSPSWLGLRKQRKWWWGFSCCISTEQRRKEGKVRHQY